MQGQLVIPGFIEGHGHFTGVGEAQLQSEADADDRAGTRLCPWWRTRRRRRSLASGSSAAAGTRRSGRRGPTRTSKAFPPTRRWTPSRRTIPVLLTHASGHASFVNAKAMEISGHQPLDAESAGRRNPEGRSGQSDRSSSRDGVRARALRREVDPATRAREGARAGVAKKRCRRASRRFRMPARRSRTIDLMKQMIDQRQIGVRLWVMVREGNEREAPLLAEVPDDRLRQSHLTVRAHQASNRRRARLTWGLAARALHRQA